MRAMRVLAVVNKTAGGETDEFVGALGDHAAVDLEVVPTVAPGDGTRCAAEGIAASAPDVVVAVGGDGTAGQVARGVAQAGPGAPPLLIAPAGTGNTNFRSLWDDRPWPEVVETVFGARRYTVHRTDLHHVRELGRATLLGCSAGVIPMALELAATSPLTGRERLLTAGLQAINDFRCYPARITVDDTVLVECGVFLAVVGGVRYRAGMLKVLPDSMHDDGRLDVCVTSDAVSPQDFVEAAVTGTLRDLPGVYYGRGRRVRLERLDGDPMKLENDGEPHSGPETSFEVEVVPGPLTVVVPDPAPDCFGAGADPRPAPCDDRPEGAHDAP